MLEQLRLHLQTLLDTGADRAAIDQAEQMIRDEEARQRATRAGNDAEMERLRAEQLSGIQRHLKQLEAAQQQHNVRLRDLQRQRAAAMEADDVVEQQRLANEILAEEERERINQRRVATARDINSKFEDFGFVTDFTKSKTGRFLSDMGGSFDALGATMASAIQPANLFAAGMGQMISATKELFTNFDTAQASLAKTTATTGEYNDMLYDVQESNKAFNVDVEKAGRAIADLHKEVSIFNQLSTDQQTALTETTARMEALGVSTSVSAKQFDNMIQGMGMSAEVANDASMELVSLGDNIGVAADVISNDFNAAAGELAKYGADAIDVFKGMASAAKATGIEMGSLMNITKQYDTFRGAAESAGKLNAILGGGVLNSMDMLNATEEERVRLLVQSISLSGKNYESLNKFEKQAIASAAGISDMTEANKLFSMSLSAYDDMQNKSSEASAEAAKLEERAQAATTFGEKLKMIGQSFAVAFLPVLEFAHGFANIILELNDMTGGMFIPTMVALVGIIALLGNATAITNGIMAVGNGIMMTRTLLTTGLGNAKAAYSLIMEGANLREKAGLALDLMSLPVKTAKNVVTLQEGAAAGAATGPSVAFAGALATISAAALPLLPAITAIGFAIAGIGLAIAAPFIALALIITAFKDLFIAMLEAPKAIGAAVAGLLAFAVAGSAAMVIMAYGLAAAVTILIPFAGAMMIVAPALAMFAGALAIAGVAMYLAGAGLKSFGEGLMVFNNVEPESLVKAIGGLMAFGLGLWAFMTVASLPMLVVGIGLMLFGAGLKSFAKGLKEFNNVGLEAMAMAAIALIGFGLLLIQASLPMGVAALLLGIPLMMIGAGLKSFGEGLAAFNKVGIAEMLTAAAALIGFGLILVKASVPMGVAGLLLGIPLMLISTALGMFAVNLRKFNRVGVDDMLKAAGSLLVFGLMMILVTAPIAFAASAIGVPLMLLGSALGSFAQGLGAFNNVGEDAIVMAIGALMSFGLAMVAMWWMIPFMVVGFLALSAPMIMFGAALTMVGLGLLFIGESIPALFALTDALGMISQIGIAGAGAMAMLAYSIMGIALALNLIPESKTMAFGFAMDGYTKAMAAVSALTPETTELAERVVAAAGEYATIQAEMKMPDEDAFVQAMKSAFGMGEKGDKGGQDIVLQINGREFGRAINAAINKKHNLRID